MASSKSKSFDWNIEITKALISLYEENECLYNNLAPDYKNRDKRLSIMANIARLISDLSGKVFLVADVRKKINSLRSQYLAEKLKITKCKSGSGGDYNPTVYWFPLLRFLDISSEADASQSNLDSESPQVDSDSMDTQQSYKNETVHPRKTKKRNSASTQDEEADSLIKEATATMRQMSQQITSNTNTDNQNHITAFCNFVNSELTNIQQASNNNFVNKAKRKIQLCLFDIWDEIDIGNLRNDDEERPSTKATNFSEDSIISENISSGTISQNIPSKFSICNTDGELHVPSKAVQSVVTGNAKSLIVRRNDLLAEIKTNQIKREYLKPQFKDFKLYCTQEDGNFDINTEDNSSVDLYHINNPQGDREIHIEDGNNINLSMTEPTEESSEKIVYFINNYDPELIVTHTSENP